MTGSFENLFFYQRAVAIFARLTSSQMQSCKQSEKPRITVSTSLLATPAILVENMCQHTRLWFDLFQSFLTDKWRRTVEQKSKVWFYFHRVFVFLKGRKSKPVQGRLMSTSFWYCQHAGFRAVMNDVQQRMSEWSVATVPWEGGWLSITSYIFHFLQTVLLAFHHHCAHIAHRAARCNTTVSRLDLKWKQKTHFQHGVRWIQDSF